MYLLLNHWYNFTISLHAFFGILVLLIFIFTHKQQEQPGPDCRCSTLAQFYFVFWGSSLNKLTWQLPTDSVCIGCLYTWPCGYWFNPSPSSVWTCTFCPRCLSSIQSSTSRRLHSRVTPLPSSLQVCPAGWKPGSDTIIPDVEKSKKFFAKQ